MKRLSNQKQNHLNVFNNLTMKRKTISAMKIHNFVGMLFPFFFLHQTLGVDDKDSPPMNIIFVSSRILNKRRDEFFIFPRAHTHIKRKKTEEKKNHVFEHFVIKIYWDAKPWWTHSTSVSVHSDTIYNGVLKRASIHHGWKTHYKNLHLNLHEIER